MEKLPIYRFVVGEDDEAEVTAVALVDYPAIEMNWQAFSSVIYVKYGGEGSGCNGDNCGRPSTIDIAELESMTNTYAYELGLKGVKVEKSDKQGLAGYVAWNKNPDGNYYMDNKISVKNGLSKEQYETTIKHELRHIYQAKEKGFYISDKGIHWENEVHISHKEYNKILKEVKSAKNKTDYDNAIKKYNSLPWENDAIGYSENNANFSLVEDDKNNIDLIDLPNEYNNDEFVTSRFKADKEKKIISGALMVADLPIYRRDEQGEYYGVFTAEDIYNIRNKFSKKNFGQEVNMMHDPNQMVDGVYMIESFIIDSERGIHSPNGFKLPNGSWFGSYKVDNQDVWDNYIKTGEFKGFSVEGVFKTVKIDSKPLDVIEQIIEILKNTED